MYEIRSLSEKKTVQSCSLMSLNSLAHKFLKMAVTKVDSRFSFLDFIQSGIAVDEKERIWTAQNLSRVYTESL